MLFVKMLFCTEISAKKNVLLIVFALISNFNEINCMPILAFLRAQNNRIGVCYNILCHKLWRRMSFVFFFVCRHYSDHMSEEGAQVSSSKVAVTT